MKLYTFFRSSAAYRVRIALNLKHLDWEHAGVHLRRGEQRRPEYGALNPQGLVPTLLDDEHVLTQSLAICEYLEERYAEPPLLPQSPVERARVRALAYVVACEIHPLNNLRVLNYLTDTLGVDETQKLAWYRHWVALGLEALEKMLAGDARTGRYCHGDTPTLADVCLVPQVANAVRFECDLAPYPTVRRINEACLELPEFDGARPENQPDAE
ncbi:MAG: maleylacetoacetate isomerase [Gammaproteobacteria bacterium]|nr:maleylacetoacetate isomerase [Gammaproteobacteria bacterium]NIR84908.1 maleylacetoacetate isomerase [Gammaproteobacteria bacterium]NIR91757.1 maleylacetoacetate isomerase [Gammaproteobacteria bacterium]NIU05955.1 maleylacetoacetate isomerase [Gammaproteobacteria bacterium]NIV53002.1 maleylacetoacetate isomerase [Gammaproteobacteria bacterium]